MSNLTEFLRARLDEDEQIAREADQRKGGSVIGWSYFDFDFGDAYTWRSYGPFRHGDEPGENSTGLPTRVLAEIAAKRQVLDDAYQAGETEAQLADRQGLEMPVLEETAGGRILRSLAAVYEAHPDFDPNWKQA